MQQAKYTTDVNGKPPSPCTTLKSNQDAVNQDATVANAFLVVGIVGTAAAVGGIALVLPRREAQRARCSGDHAVDGSRYRRLHAHEIVLSASRRNVGNIAPALADVVA